MPNAAIAATGKVAKAGMNAVSTATITVPLGSDGACWSEQHLAG
jgi:hypothetical protein